jgi:DMSO/TMAO reductase YedYZ molybdopterin-dependent catalytic subunit
MTERTTTKYVDPQEALKRAKESGHVILREHPLNCETPLPEQIGILTPTPHFYIRTNFGVPAIDADTWRLEVSGLVERPLSLSLSELRRLPSRSVIVTLECAGNGRSRLDPRVEGEQWELGAVSTGEWTGVPLVEVLNRAGLKPTAREIVFRAADSGTPRGRTDIVRFERSLKLDWATNPDVLLVYAMNGELLPQEHGFPLRIVVPSWYGMASVKWLTRIEAIDGEFDGHYQANNYVFERQEDGRVTKEPLTQERVRAQITQPAPDQKVERGEIVIRGVAWSGQAPIDRVDVQVGDAEWREARLLDYPIPYTWRRWELITRVDRSGPIVLRARATDANGRTQPDEPEWNRLGYCNNAIVDVPIDLI